MGPPAVKKLDEVMRGIPRLGVDTAPWIYLVERHPDHVAVMREIIRRAEADDGNFDLVTSVLTLTEVLTLPLREQQQETAAAYRSILLNSPHLQVVPVDMEVAEGGARLRAAYEGLKTPDAIQLAVAIQSGCGAFLTNDHRIPAVREIPVIQLSDLTL